jgi:DNA-nicking Smr family endonuclease
VEHRLPIDGTLDLHAFRPADAADVVADWLDACAEAGLREVRVVHGKGIGALRRTVLSFRTAGEDGGGWGATLVTLREPGAAG